MPSGFNFTKIVVIQSLKPLETQTGQILYDFLICKTREKQLKIPIELFNVQDRTEFRQKLKSLTCEAMTGQIPIIQVECHGDPEHGLIFANGGMLEWKEVAEELRRVNIACRFNLLAVFSACFGGYFLSQMGAMQQAPCWCMIGPAKKTYPSEILKALDVFYSTLFARQDAGVAIRALSKIKTREGYWFGQPAELWFERLVLGYVEVHCTKRAIRQRAKKLYRKLLKEGDRKSIGYLTRTIRKRNRKTLVEQYFDTNFMTTDIPENKLRFSACKISVQAKIGTLRSKQLYVI